MGKLHHVKVLISALRFQHPEPELLRKLSDLEWKQLLGFSDRARLTLILGRSCWDQLPDCVRSRLHRNFADNTERTKVVQQAYKELSATLAAVGAQHLVLKGFALWPYFISDLRLRPQWDIDLYCPADSILRAKEALVRIGYETCRTPERYLGDHLAILARPFIRRWRGNAFDPDITPAVELHHQFWGHSYTRIGPASLEAFWERRCTRIVWDIEFQSLDPIDSFAHAALHALRHLLHNELTPSHIYELGFFLHHNAKNMRLWDTWLARHHEELRLLTAACSLLAARWFACRLPEAVEEEIQRLPRIVPRWFQRFGESILANLSQLNKDALWLHLGLIHSPRDKFLVLRRRLFPLWIPPLNSQSFQETDENGRAKASGRLQTYSRYLNWFARRTIQHLRVLPSTVWGGLRLWLART